MNQRPDRFGVRDLGAPWYAGFPSFLRAPIVQPDSVPAAAVAVAGVPIDHFANSSGRGGMRWAPRRIREASLRLSVYFGNQTDVGLVDVRTGAITNWPETLRLADTGDAPVIHHDVEAQLAAIVDHVRAASSTSALTVTLGGDHSVAYPAFLGTLEAWRARRPGLRVGYLFIDTHTDFVDERIGSGRYSQSTCARRVSELAEVERLAWFGLSSTTEPGQVREMNRRGFRAYTSSYVRRVGAAEAMKHALDYLRDGVDAIYASVDIDVVNNADAPATASPVFEGVSAREFLEALRTLAEVEDLIGFDLCEVNPEVDQSWRTEILASMAIMTLIGRRIYSDGGTVDPAVMSRVFFT